MEVEWGVRIIGDRRRWGAYRKGETRVGKIILKYMGVQMDRLYTTDSLYSKYPPYTLRYA